MERLAILLLFCVPLLAQQPTCWDVYITPGPCGVGIVNVAAQEPRQTFTRVEVEGLISSYDSQIVELKAAITAMDAELKLEKQRSEEYKVLAGAINKSWWRKSETWISVGIAAVSVLATR
ncbi:MAG: hypothetical protein U1E51_30190 [Candidatus Binatia bacterium]|nr:hypothetical protein [Candidatus Binatia bacterium]